jgi:LmbE family N-acetylglucosaminyl deacetylase
LSAVLFSPHNDDETLFAFYTMVRTQARAVVVLRSMRQELSQRGPTFRVREGETLCATTVAGVEYEQWTEFTDDNPDWDAIAANVDGYLRLEQPDVVIYPAWEQNGHEDHNALATICTRVVGHLGLKMIRYYTYARGSARTEAGVAVVPTPAERAQKMAALRCYASQAAHPPTASWFGVDQREFLAT